MWIYKSLGPVVRVGDIVRWKHQPFGTVEYIGRVLSLSSGRELLEYDWPWLIPGMDVYYKVIHMMRSNITIVPGRHIVGVDKY